MSGTMHLGQQRTDAGPPVPAQAGSGIRLETDQRVCAQEGPQPILPLSAVQFATLEAVATAALNELSTQIRRATPFSPVKAGLRARAAGMRQILRDHEVPLRSVPMVTEVLDARLEVLRQQLRHCDSPNFKARLRAEEQRVRELCATTRRAR
jgi:hypothetical protein